MCQALDTALGKRGHELEKEQERGIGEDLEGERRRKKYCN